MILNEVRSIKETNGERTTIIIENRKRISRYFILFSFMNGAYIWEVSHQVNERKALLFNIFLVTLLIRSYRVKKITLLTKDR